MNFQNFPSRLFRTGLGLGLGLRLGLTLGLASLAADVTAQQVVCFSFDGVEKISGKDSTGGDSKTGVRVGGQTVMLDTKPGDSPATCASKLDAALKTAGFTTKKASSTVVCVEAGADEACPEHVCEVVQRAPGARWSTDEVTLLLPTHRG